MWLCSFRPSPRHVRCSTTGTDDTIYQSSLARGLRQNSRDGLSISSFVGLTTVLPPRFRKGSPGYEASTPLLPCGKAPRRALSIDGPGFGWRDARRTCGRERKGLRVRNVLAGNKRFNQVKRRQMTSRISAEWMRSATDGGNPPTIAIGAVVRRRRGSRGVEYNVMTHPLR